jgi:hypothetical protein
VAQPTPYNKNRNFSQWQADNPNTVHEGSALDAEFDDIETSLDETLVNLALIQRDDGKLRNGSVHQDAFSAASLALIASDWTPKGLWVTATAYVIGDLVEKDGVAYVAAEAHTSGTFATDHAAGKWIAFAEVTEMGLQAGAETFAAAAGTVDAITATFTPTITALTDGMQLRVRAAGANATTTPTLDVDGLGAKTIVKNGGQALVAGDIFGAGHVLLLVYQESADQFELLNPGMTVTAFARTLLDDANAATARATLGAGAAGDSLFTTATANAARRAISVPGSVSTIAALKALTVANLSDGDIVEVMGYAAINDGGHGPFYWDASSSDTADDGIVVLPTGHVGNGRWIRIRKKGHTNPRWYGAVGDGSTDDYDAFLAAHNALPSQGGVMEVPPTPGSSYVINTALNWAKDFAVVVAYGAYFKSTAAIRIFEFSGVYRAGFLGGVFDFRGNDTSLGAFEVSSLSEHCYLRDVVFFADGSCPSGFIAVRCNQAFWTNIENCYFQNRGGTGNAPKAIELINQANAAWVSHSTFAGFDECLVVTNANSVRSSENAFEQVGIGIQLNNNSNNTGFSTYRDRFESCTTGIKVDLLTAPAVFPSIRDPFFTGNTNNVLNPNNIPISGWINNGESSTGVGINSDPTGSVVIADTDAAAVVTLSATEEDENYVVDFVVSTESGSPALGAYNTRLGTRTTTTFAVGLEAAPGSGTSVRVHWRLRR